MPSPWGLLTWRGRLLLFLGLAVSVVAAAVGQRQVLWLGIFLMLLPFLAMVLLGTAHPRVRVVREVRPAQAPVGSEMVGTLKIMKERRNLTGGLLLFEESVPHALGARPRFAIHQFEGQGRREFTYTLRGRQRGRYQTGPLRVEIRDPFGLARLQRGQRRTTEVLVTPLVLPLPGGRWASGGGATGEESPERLGSMGEDDVLVREYRHGDDTRRIHWRSTAKYRELMVRREEQAWDPSATILLDSRAAAHRGGGATGSFEWNVTAAASIAIHLVKAGYRVDLVDAAGALLATNISHERHAAEQLTLEFLTDEALTSQPTLQSLLTGAAQAHGGQLIVAIVGALTPLDATMLLTARGPNQRALAIVNDVESFPGGAGARTRDQADATARLVEGGWSVTHGGATIDPPHAWAAAEPRARS